MLCLCKWLQSLRCYQIFDVLQQSYSQYIPCSHNCRDLLVLAWSSVSSVCECGCVGVCELGHSCIAFDLGEALRCIA